VILYGRAEDADLLIQRGFAVDYRNGGLLLAHFEGCPLSLELISEDDSKDGMGNLLANARIEMGWFPLLEVSRRYSHSPGATTRIPLNGAPCGPVWLRVTGAPDAQAERGVAPRTCRGADHQGRLILEDTRKTPIVRCTLGTS
jgi:hypothetical protein